VCFRDPDRRAEPRGLDEDRIAERVLRSSSVPKRDVAGDRDSLVAHHRLEEVLVHAEGGGGDAGADVRDTGHLEHALERAVLPERAVQDRQDDLDLPERRSDLARRGRNGRLWTIRSCRRCFQPWAQSLADVAGRESPAAVTADLDRHDLVALRIERLQHGLRGGERDRVFR
jgi:hypothetical protein